MKDYGESSVCSDRETILHTGFFVFFQNKSKDTYFSKNGQHFEIVEPVKFLQNEAQVAADIS